MIKNRVDQLLADPLDSTLVLTLTVPIVLVAGDPVRASVGAAVALTGLALPKVRRNAFFWLGLALVYGLWFALQYDSADDHLALAVYWYLALGLALLTDDPRTHLQLNSRVLLGLTFGFAVAWKLRSPDFVDGGFFEYKLLTDPRFSHVAELVSGLTRDQALANRLAFAAAPSPSQLLTMPRIDLAARLMTAGALVVEPLVAVSWLTNWTWSRRTRHLFLATFFVVAYSVVPVGGFGVILGAVGIASAGSARVRAAYALGLGVLFIWSVVAASLL